MYIYMCIYTHTYIYRGYPDTYTYITYIHIYAYTTYITSIHLDRIYIYMCTYVHMHINTYVHIFIYIYMCSQMRFTVPPLLIPVSFA